MSGATTPTVHTSRKVRRCDCCGRVEIGERYLKWRWYDGADASTANVHPACWRLLQRVWSEQTTDYGDRVVDYDHIAYHRQEFSSHAGWEQWLREALGADGPDHPDDPWDPALTPAEVEEAVAREMRAAEASLDADKEGRWFESL